MRLPIFTTFLLSCIIASASENVIFAPDLTQGNSPGGGTVTQDSGMPVLTFSCEEKSSRYATFPVDPALLAGREVVLSADIAYRGVEKPSPAWRGIKLMLTLEETGGRKHYSQAPAGFGTAPWRVHGVRIQVPAEIRRAEIVLGLEECSGTVQFRNVKLVQPEQVDYGKFRLTGHTGHRNGEYKIDEPMQFIFELSEEGQPAAGTLLITRNGDDGLTESQQLTVKAGEPVIYTSSIDRPGFVMVEAQLIDRHGCTTRCPEGEIRFGLGAGAAADTLEQGVPEPSDFDKFWKEKKEELAALPVRELKRTPVQKRENADLFDIKVACPGNRPVSGYLSIPHGAEPGSLPLHVYFDGYSVQSARIVSYPGALILAINPHGIENGREAEYYRDLAQGELRSYGFRNDENQNADTSYFKNMVLRAIRAVEYGRTLPQWNRREIHVSGGSQGAFQAASAAALAEGVTSCKLDVPWLCDLGGIEKGRLRGWRPDWTPALGYFDTVNMARRITCPVELSAGLSDYVCPPSGTRLLYNVLKSPATLTFYQGLNHAPYPGFRHHTAEKTVYRK